MTNRNQLDALLAQHQLATALKYGTAGFRGPADTLPAAMFRCGVLAALRSRARHGLATGVMVTASHNPAPDNGVKLVDPDGSMLAADWEAAATPFVNAAPADALSTLSALLDVDAAVAAAAAGEDQQEGAEPAPAAPAVVVGCDTRDSSPALVQLVADGAKAAGAGVVNLGVVTTPQLHAVVRARWQRAPAADVDAYFAALAAGFAALVGKAGVSAALTARLVVDCANGVGAPAMDRVAGLLPGARVVNRPGDGALNADCGADFVQKRRAMPTVHDGAAAGDEAEAEAAAAGPELWASLDGDADRLVVFRRGDDGAIVLADGDRFATLLARFVATRLKTAHLSGLSVAVAQTAYSNGAATELLAGMPGVEVVIAKTGVKHLEKAVKPFDIGIYWEPNGHGTVLFSEAAVKTITTAREGLAGGGGGDGSGAVDTATDELASLDALLAVSRVANQAVGDGIADLLLVLGVLSREGMSFEDWLGMYDERCSSNMVVRVADKGVIETADCDRLVQKPEPLRDAIANVASGNGCRAFVRPSGTEDVVRVYAEAPVGCEGKAQEMAMEISRAVFDHCGGVGDRPGK